MWNIDADLHDADWIKVKTWDLPTDPEAFLSAIGGRDHLAAFMARPAAAAMPTDLRAHLNTANKYSDTQERDDHGRFGSGSGDSADKPYSPERYGAGLATLTPEIRGAVERQVAALEAQMHVPVTVDAADLMEKFGEGMATVGYTAGDGNRDTIYLNTNSLNNATVMAAINNQNDQGFHVPGTQSVPGYLTHEFGHALDAYLVQQKDAAWLAWRDEAHNAYLGGGGLSGLSGYASEGGFHEAVAEGFAAAFVPSARVDEPWRADVQALKDAALAAFPKQANKYNEDQERDDHGRFGSGSGDGEAHQLLSASQFHDLVAASSAAVDQRVAAEAVAAAAGVKASFTGMDPEAAMSAAKEIASLTERYGLPSGYHLSIVMGHEEPGSYASTQDTSARSAEITLDSDRFDSHGDFRTAYADDVRTGWAPPANDAAAAIIAHEYGHALDASTGWGGADMIFDQMTNAGGLVEHDMVNALGHIGGYARTSQQEAFATVFSSIVMGSRAQIEKTYPDTKPVYAMVERWLADNTTTKAALPDLAKYSEDQPRDDHGRFGEGGGGDAKPGVSLPRDWSQHGDYIMDGQGNVRSEADAARYAREEQAAAHISEINAAHAGTLYYAPSLSALRDTEAMTQTVDRIAALQDQFPRVPLGEVTTAVNPGPQPTLVAWTDRWEEAVRGEEPPQIVLSSSNGYNGGHDWSESANRGWLIDSSPAGVATHEFGHVVDAYMRGQMREGTAAGQAFHDWAMTSTLIKEPVSGYSAAKGDLEAFAELFSAAYSPGAEQYQHDGAAEVALRDMLTATGVDAGARTVKGVSSREGGTFLKVGDTVTVREGGRYVATGRVAYRDADELIVRRADGSTLLLKYSEDQERDDHGRFGSGGGGDVSSAVVSGAAQGGFTVQPYRGSSPKTGYQVAITGHTTKLPDSILQDHAALSAALGKFIGDNHDVLTAGGRMYIGGWAHEGTLYLEPSERVSSRAEAVRLGSERGQYSIWDNAGSREITTGGTTGLQ